MSHDLVTTVLAAVWMLASCPFVVADEREFLVRNVHEIAAPGVPGPLVVVGEGAFVIATGKSGKYEAPVVAAAEFGKGRLVAFGHTGYADAPDIGETRALLRNAIAWSCHASAEEAAKLEIVVLDNGWAKGLREMGLKVREPGRAWIGALSATKVVCVSQSPCSDEEIRALRQYIRDGGGVLAAGLGWGWLQLNPRKTIDQHPLNRVFAEMGILWADDTMDRTCNSGFKITDKVSPNLNASTALDSVLATRSQQDKPTRDLLQAGETLTRAVRTLPAGDSALRPRLKQLLQQKSGELLPTEKSPLTSSNGLSRTLLALQIAELAATPAEEIRAHPAAADFPGTLPAEAKPTSREIEIDCRKPDWHSLGLYAAPGELVTVEIPESAKEGGYRIRIGAHRDELWDQDKWSRVPEITFERSLTEKVTLVASPFGGPVYFVVPEQERSGNVRIRVGGAYEMPHYIHGVTAIDEWRSRIRKLPAPWAELESSKVILTIPAHAIRDLDNPGEVMRFWDELCDAHATLAAISLERKRPERFVADVQISAGYMHSGYPIMTHLDVSDLFVDIKRLRAGKAWGFFHELGHNHQESDWTFDGTGEVTCNLFALHAIDTICTPVPNDRGHEAVNNPPSIPKFIADGARFERWKSDPFLALQMYVQMQREFGWQPFKEVFAEYRKLEKAQRPKNDNEKRDQWMVRFSRKVGRNLGPFFETWGVPTSKSARESIADLPVWVPEDLKAIRQP